MGSARTYDHAFYERQREGSIRSARVVLPLLRDWLNPRSVLDVGCGVGTWLRAWQEIGVSDVVGVDGSWVAEDQLLIPRETFRRADLTHVLDLGRRFDLVMSLEVAEHLRPGSAVTFVDNLIRHSDVVLFGAAVPFAGGDGHVHEAWPSYWASVFASKGYRILDYVRPRVWTVPEVEWWYAQDTLVFVSEKALKEGRVYLPPQSASTMPLDVVHPTRYLMSADPSRVGLRALLRAFPHAVRRALRRITRAGDDRRYAVFSATKR